MSLPGRAGPGWPLVAPPHRALEPGDPATVGPYRIEAVLGDGGMGRVYLGRTAAGAAVAVKVLHREFAEDGAFRQRLAHELAAVRQVQGLYTVPVVDADPGAERPWLASPYVDGPSLRHAVTAHGPGPADTVLWLVATVAEALQALHAAGVVHRDLTPGNVLLTAGGPRLTDFGVVHAADGTAVTRHGTPAYLAPEYIRGEEVTGAADVFALGSLAYFAATGRPAFGGGHAQAVTYRIVAGEPDLTGCAEPLRAIVVACLDKDPRRRPSPAEIVARCQAGAPTGPPPPPRPVVEAPPPAPAPPARPAAPRAVTRRRLLLGGAGLAGVAALGITIPLVLADDDAEDPGGTQPAASGPFRLAATLGIHRSAVNEVAFSPDGRVLATMSGDDVRLWDVVSRRQRAVLTGPAMPAFGLAFSPDGTLLASGCDQSVVLWDVATREIRTVLSGHTGVLSDVAFSPDGRFVASAADDETARLWDVASGRQHAVLAGHNTRVTGVAFHPAGRLLASSAGQAVFLWDVPDGTRADLIGDHDGVVMAVEFGPDGTVLAAADGGTGDAGARVVLWDMASARDQREKAVLGGHEKPVHGLAFSPDGTLLATAAEQAKVWDVAELTTVAALAADEIDVRAVAFSRTGTLATAGTDSRARLWE
ncbi:WD40 repeat domain-containing serine/threonine protein kinase [Actinophytocola sp. KF-1]